MNAVIFYMTDSFRLTGSTINAIEYFLACVEHNPTIKLLLLNCSPRYKTRLMDIIKDRYITDGLKLENIECIHPARLVTQKIHNALVVDYMTISRTKGRINAKKILVISEKYTESERFFYDKNLYNVSYYGEMPFHYRDFDYRMKCLFDRYRPLGKVKKGTYVNSPRNPHTVDISKFPQPAFFKSKKGHKENLFEQFTHYAYVHCGGWFDPHPRLFLECTFYDKEIIYINDLDIQDGSYYRMQDIRKNGLKDRTLTKEDDIICQMI